MASGYPNLAALPPTAPSPKRPTDKSDVVATTVLLVLGAFVWAGAACMELFVMAFTDYCPAQTCSADRAFTSITVGLSAAAALVVLGAVVAILRIVRRRSGWPFAAAALVLSIAAEVLGLVGYVAAVGY
ncbi:hypothetical protein [Mycobacterium sp.]|uniref:hypothetical protein n=1 Tax=Mycobacterium sp. TaxID=1785 RepID=UPI003C7361F4